MIQLQLQDAAYGTTGKYKVSWISSVSKQLDTKQPDIYDKYSKESCNRRFIVKRAA